VVALEKDVLMNANGFMQELEARIATYDLLCHPFYKAWSEGHLTREDLCEYACDYYHHIQAFPTYLAEFAVRLEESDLRRAVLSNLCDETGGRDSSDYDVRPHSELWLDFVEGMGGNQQMYGRQAMPEVKELITHFSQVAREGSPAEALAAFYAYESQVPRVAQAKAKGLRELYGADEKTTGYFTLHETADIYHSRVWLQELQTQVLAEPESATAALDAAEAAAKALWNALDGIEARRTAKVAA
jgi:pyrroloquinoline-quinone synthase